MAIESLNWAIKHSPYSGTQFAIHLMVADLVNEPYDYQLFASQSWIASKARCSRATVNTWLQTAIDDGLLALVEDNGSQRRPNKYRFLMPDLPVVFDSRNPGGMTTSHTPCDESERGDVSSGHIPCDGEGQGDVNSVDMDMSNQLTSTCQTIRHITTNTTPKVTTTSSSCAELETENGSHLAPSEPVSHSVVDQETENDSQRLSGVDASETPSPEMAPVVSDSTIRSEVVEAATIIEGLYGKTAITALGLDQDKAPPWVGRSTTTKQIVMAVKFCVFYADQLEDGGVARPNPFQKRWANEARMLFVNDGIDPAEVRRVALWALNDDFWKYNVLSVPKFRKQWNQLQGKSRQHEQRSRNSDDAPGGEGWMARTG